MAAPGPAKIAAADPERVALGRLLDAYLRRLALPHGPTLYVAGALLSQTEQRRSAALDAYAVLRRSPAGNDARVVEQRTRIGRKRALLALDDLVAIGAARRSPGSEVHEAVPVGPRLVTTGRRGTG